jgi:hypothetical protein
MRGAVEIETKGVCDGLKNAPGVRLAIKICKLVLSYLHKGYLAFWGKKV